MRKFLLILIILLFTSPALATDYFFSTSGNDNGDADGNVCEYNGDDCTSGSPCKTVECMNEIMDNISPGANRVLLKAGDTWDKATSAQWSNGSLSNIDTYIDINVSGTNDSNRFVFGAWEGSAYTATPTTKPAIDYNGEIPPTGPVVDASSETGPDYIIIENLNVYDVGGTTSNFGIKAGATADFGEWGTGIIIQKNEVHKTAGEGIILQNGDDALITLNHVYDSERFRGETSCVAVGGTAIYLDRETKNTTVSYNDIHDSYGECIGAYYNGNYGSPNIIEYNKIYNCRSAGIHVTDGHMIVRYNFMGYYDPGGNGIQPHFFGGSHDLGDMDAANYDNGDGVGCGPENTGSVVMSGHIVLTTTPANEKIKANHYEAYGNLLFGSDKVGLSCTHGRTEYDTLVCFYYNNTLVDNKTPFSMHYHDWGGTADSYVQNNLITFYNMTPGGPISTQDGGYIEADHNLWPSIPNWPFSGTGDVITTDAKLTRTSGWMYPSDMDTITAQDFALLDGSPAIDVGVDLGDGDFDDAIASADFNADPITVTLGDQHLYDAAWEIGALLYTRTTGPGQIYMSEQFTYDNWTLWYTSGEGLGSPVCDTGGEKCIYRFTDATFDDWLSPINVWNTVRSTDGGTTWARVKHPGQSTMGIWSEGSIQSSLANVSYYWNATNDPGDYIYFRCDYDTCNSATDIGTFEIPLRQYGIDVGDNDYITIDGLTFRYGGATDDFTPENSMAIKIGDSTDIILTDIAIEYSGYWSVGAPGPVDNLRIIDSYFHDLTAGILVAGTYTNHVPSSQASTDVTIAGSYFDKIGSVAWDEGDIEAIHLDGISGAIIAGNFFGETQYGDSGNALSSQVEVLHSEDIILARNYSYRAGHRAFTFGGSETTLQTSNITMLYNIFDSWGYYSPVDLNNTSVTAAVEVNETNFETYGDTYPDDHGYDLKIYGNLFINGPDLLQGGYTPKSTAWDKEKDSTLHIGYMKYSSIEMYNNIFYDNNSFHEWNLQWHTDTAKNTVYIENNFLYDTYDETGQTQAEQNEVIRYANLCSEHTSERWRYNRVVGGSDDYWSYDWVEGSDCGFTDGTNNDNSSSNPVLLVTTAGPSYVKKLGPGSPGIDAGFNLGYSFDDMLNPSTDFTTTPPTVVSKSQFSFNLWEIGPYIYFTTDGKFK